MFAFFNPVKVRSPGTIILLCLFPWGACTAGADISTPEKFTTYLQSLSRELSETRKPSQYSFAGAYYHGIQRKYAKQIPTAIALFTRAAFEENPGVKEKHSLEEAMEILKKASRKSLLQEEATIQLVKIAITAKEFSLADTIMQTLTTPDEQISRRKNLWRGKIALQNNPAGALDIFNELLKTYPQDPEILYTAGYAFQKNARTPEALSNYYKTLEHPENDWTYTLATRQILETLNKSQIQSLPEILKVRIAEGLRMLSKKNDALTLMSKVRVNKLEENQYYIYIQNYSRILISAGKTNQLTKFLLNYGKKISTSEREKLYEEFTERLVKNNKYQAVLDILKGSFKSSTIYFNKLKAVYRVSKNERRKVAREYLEKFDRDSFFAEKTFFSVCREFLEKNAIAQAVECLNELKQITENAKTGAAARYYLAKHSVENSPERQLLFEQVYLNSPEDFYVFKAAERMKPVNSGADFSKSNNIETNRQWVAQNLSDKSALARFLSYKKKNPAFSVDAQWHSWEKELKNTMESINDNEKRAVLLYVLDERNSAMPYFKGIDKMRQQLLLAQAGYITQRSDLPYFAIKYFCREKKIPVDIFTMSDKAIRTFYPVVHRKYIKRAAQKNQIDEARLYGLMKQESGFYSKARSSVGAMGLMQVMPATAKMLNRKAKLKPLNLLNPEHSIILGALFYGDLNKQYNGIMEYVAVAYNAGPGRLIKWRKKYSRDTDLFTEQIPFAETHFYVKVTRADYDRYALLLKAYYEENETSNE